MYSKAEDIKHTLDCVYKDYFVLIEELYEPFAYKQRIEKILRLYEFIRKNPNNCDKEKEEIVEVYWRWKCN